MTLNIKPIIKQNQFVVEFTQIIFSSSAVFDVQQLTLRWELKSIL